MKRLVEFRRNTILNVGGRFVLKPGVNEVEESVITEARRLAVFEAMIDEEIIVVREDPAPENLSAMKSAVAIALVEKTVDRTLLTKWFDGEKRKNVLEAIQSQVDRISKPSSGDTETDDLKEG